MVTPRTPERAVIRRTHNHPPHAEQQLFLAVRALPTPIQDRWLLEFAKLLHKLPPAQPPLPSILPQFNPGPPPQSLLSSPAPPGIIPRRRITSVNVFNEPQPPPTFDQIYERHNRRLADLKNHPSSSAGAVQVAAACWPLTISGGPSTKSFSGKSFKRRGTTPAADGGKRCPGTGSGA